MSSSSLRETVEAIYRAAIDRVEAGATVRRTLTRDADGNLLAGGDQIALAEESLWAIAIGKAAAQMMATVEDVVGGRLEAGLVVTKNRPSDIALQSEVLLGSHPVPDQRSLDAGERVIAFARSVPPGATVLCLISGGGSALVEALVHDITLKQLRDATETLLGSGASIDEINPVRTRVSRLKGGGLLRILAGRRVVNLIVSDVLGNALPTIASGPTVLPDERVVADDVVAKYGIDLPLPAASSEPIDPPLSSIVVADIAAAMEAAAVEARARGLTPYVLTSSVDIEARQAGRMFAGIVADTVAGTANFSPPCCILAGGETVVTLRGDGTGGRNCEAAVAAAIRISGLDGCAIGCLATDGDDGNSGAAGGIVDGATLDDPGRAEAALASNDTATWLRERGVLFETGPTGTNVNDLLIGVVRSTV